MAYVLGFTQHKLIGEFEEDCYFERVPVLNGIAVCKNEQSVKNLQLIGYKFLREVPDDQIEKVWEQARKLGE